VLAGSRPALLATHERRRPADRPIGSASSEAPAADGGERHGQYERVVADEQASTLAEGALILGKVLTPRGFNFEPGGQLKGSGGPAAWGLFVRDGQRIELHFRHSLGLVSYAWGDTVLGHQDYLRGVNGVGSYPGFSADPLDGFRHLADDLAGPLAGFVSGDQSSFIRAAEFVRSSASKRLP
jgi:hypothetical protein